MGLASSNVSVGHTHYRPAYEHIRLWQYFQNYFMINTLFMDQQIECGSGNGLFRLLPCVSVGTFLFVSGDNAHQKKLPLIIQTIYSSTDLGGAANAPPYRAKFLVPTYKFRHAHNAYTPKLVQTGRALPYGKSWISHYYL